MEKRVRRQAGRQAEPEQRREAVAVGAVRERHEVPEVGHHAAGCAKGYGIPAMLVQMYYDYASRK